MPVLSVYNNQGHLIFDRQISPKLMGEFGVLGYAETDHHAVVRLNYEVTSVDPEELLRRLHAEHENDIGRQDDFTDEEILDLDDEVTLQPEEEPEIVIHPVENDPPDQAIHTTPHRTEEVDTTNGNRRPKGLKIALIVFIGLGLTTCCWTSMGMFYLAIIMGEI